MYVTKLFQMPVIFVKVFSSMTTHAMEDFTAEKVPNYQELKFLFL